MSLFSLSQAAAWLDARLIGEDRAIDGVGTDTRRLEPGQLFVALAGPRFDGHDFAPEAVAGGAAALLVSRELGTPLPQLLVPDTRLALGRLAAAWRATLAARVVGITGSNGKTTTKEMIAAILAAVGPTAATQGNLNNDIGVPLTLLAARDEAFLVVEMGANHSGEIAALTAMVRPHVALITNAGRAHLEGFGSREAVARAKGEILGGLGPEGFFVLNADDPWAPLWRALAGSRRVLSFGLGGGAKVRPEPGSWATSLNGSGFHCRYRVHTPRGRLDLELALAGRHNLMNALAAVAVAEALALEPTVIGAALAGLRPLSGRLNPLATTSGARLIDDSYNANPESVAAALELLKGLPGRRWLVLGDLAELGSAAAGLHRELGVQARQAGLERLWAVGPLSSEAVVGFGGGGRQFQTPRALEEALAPELGPADVVLVKGSRSAGMERVVRTLTGNAGG
jgi:UDP-N-acetylmuramoyl-tripeptide--D-alanyl-D-alanine ligase